LLVERPGAEGRGGRPGGCRVGGSGGCRMRGVGQRTGMSAVGLILVAVLVGAVAVAGCGPAPSRSTADGAGDATATPPETAVGTPVGPADDDGTVLPEAEDPFPLTVVDGHGRTVTVDQAPQRIVSIAPSATEILFALGCGDRVVGVDDYSNYPPEALEKERVGPYYPPNIEMIVGLTPDLVLGLAFEHHEAAGHMEDLGVNVVLLPAGGVEDVLTAIELVGRVAGADDRGQELASSLRTRIEAIRRVVDRVPQEDRPRVYYEVWSDPLMTVGPGSLIAEVIDIAGGCNIAADAEMEYPTLSPETIIDRDPEIIIYPLLHGSATGTTPEDFAARPGWDSISAVADRRIAGVNDDIVSRPGPRVAQAIEELAKTFHPRLFD